MVLKSEKPAAGLNTRATSSTQVAWLVSNRLILKSPVDYNLALIILLIMVIEQSGVQFGQ